MGIGTTASVGGLNDLGDCDDAGSGGAGGGDWDDSGKGNRDNDDDGKDEDGNDEFGPLLSFQEVMQETESRGVTLPADMLQAAKSGGIQKLLLLRYFEMQVSTFFSILVSTVTICQFCT
jgi:hypothetical protein